MITGEQIIDRVHEHLGTIEELGLETFLIERDVDPEAVKVLCRCYGQDIIEGAADVGGVVVQALILGFAAGYLARDAQVAA